MSPMSAASSGTKKQENLPKYTGPLVQSRAPQNSNQGPFSVTCGVGERTCILASAERNLGLHGPYGQRITTMTT